MASVFNVILPIFALILAGFLCRRLGILGPGAASEINRMVVWLCLPALLFKVTATATWSEIWHPGFIVAFGAGAVKVGRDGRDHQNRKCTQYAQVDHRLWRRSRILPGV